MEQALRYELIQAIPELEDEIYPTNAPEDSQKPYLVYARINTNKVKTLEGYANRQALSYMFSIMATRYSDMVDIRHKIEELLLGMAQRYIGHGIQYYVEDIDINNIDEVYEHELKVNRGIIDFTIYI